MTAAVRVSQLVDGDQFSVLVSFDPARIVVDTKNGLQVLLTRGEAMLLDHELGAAASPPPKCEVCNLYATVALDGVNLCAAHHLRAEIEKNLSLGRER